MFFDDAVTALTLLDVEQREWQTREGYPIFLFRSEKLEAHAAELVACGLTVKVMKETPSIARTPASSNVVSIAAYRREARG